MGTVAVVAGPGLAIAASGMSANVAREIADEVVDQAWEASTGTPSPFITGFSDIAQASVRRTIKLASKSGKGSRLVIRSGSKGGDVRKASFIREVKKGESIDNLIGEAKYYTFSENVEVALIQLKDGSRHLVSGGRHGIELPNNTAKLYGHTHPNTKGGINGPSVGDRQVLDILDQSRTYIFHDGQRTTIFKGKDSSHDIQVTDY